MGPGASNLDTINDNSVLLLTTAKASARLGIPLRSFNRLVTKGEIPFVLISNRRYFVPEDLLKFIEDRRVPASATPHAQPARLISRRPASSASYDFEALRKAKRGGKHRAKSDTKI